MPVAARTPRTCQALTACALVPTVAAVMLAGCGGGSAAQPDSALCAAGRDLAGALQQARGPGADPADPAAADATARLVPLLPDDLRRDVERYFQRQRERGPSAPDAHYRQLFTRISDHVLRQCGIDLPGE